MPEKNLNQLTLRTNGDNGALGRRSTAAFALKGELINRSITSSVVLYLYFSSVLCVFEGLEEIRIGVD